MAKSKNYEEFVEKFKPKRTTDDCFTPPEIYETVKAWVCDRYNIDSNKVVRPFWPGANYQTTEYPVDCVVIDNPPFSILSQICKWYSDNRIRFFLFAPALTIMTNETFKRGGYIITDCSIEYENGAIVKTSFVTNLESNIVAQTSPMLTKLVNNKCEEIKRKKTPSLPKYSYPDYIVTSAMMQKWAKYGVEFKVRREDCMLVSRLDHQKEAKKVIYGRGLLLSEKAAAEKAAAEKAAAEKAAAIVWKLSDRERAIVKSLGKDES